MIPRKLFVAGSTGATGKVLVRMAAEGALPLVPHVRPKSVASAPKTPAPAVVELADLPGLISALGDCSTVIQLVGTMRSRFGAGDTYETSDIGTTRQLVDAAQKAHVDHLILLSSVGAGQPRGAYLKAKARAEALVIESGIPFTIFRPSFLEGGDRKAIPGARAITRLFGLRRYQPITLEELSRAILDVAMQRSELGQVLEGPSLWKVVERNLSAPRAAAL